MQQNDPNLYSTRSLASLIPISYSSSSSRVIVTANATGSVKSIMRELVVIKIVPLELRSMVVCSTQDTHEGAQRYRCSPCGSSADVVWCTRVVDVGPRLHREAAQSQHRLRCLDKPSSHRSCLTSRRTSTDADTVALHGSAQRQRRFRSLDGAAIKTPCQARGRTYAQTATAAVSRKRALCVGAQLAHSPHREKVQHPSPPDSSQQQPSRHPVSPLTTRPRSPATRGRGQQRASARYCLGRRRG